MERIAIGESTKAGSIAAEGGFDATAGIRFTSKGLLGPKSTSSEHQPRRSLRTVETSQPMKSAISAG